MQTLSKIPPEHSLLKPLQILSQLELKDSIHLDLLSESSPSWTDPSGTLVVRQVTSSSSTAILTVCRPDGNTEATYDKCTDFWDNDCDGLIGEHHNVIAKEFALAQNSVDDSVDV